MATSRLGRWRERPGVFYGSVSLGLFVAGYLVAVFLLFPPPPVPKDGVIVPNLHGMTVDLARRSLTPLGLETGETLSLPHPQTPAGLVIAQSPLPGQQARAGGRVNLGLSSGVPAVAIPNLIGFGARRAQNLLTRLGFTVDQILESSEQPNGTVIRSAPDAGLKLSLPARVVLYVSAGLPDSVVVDTTVRDTLRQPR
jgi:beta-lactam-binding protein with PASTA domain